MRSQLKTYALSIVVMSVFVVLRLVLDPLLGDTDPFDALLGGVAAAVWLGGYRPALVATVLGYLICDFLFVQPRHHFGFGGTTGSIGLVVSVITATVILTFGEALRRAHLRANSLAAIVESSDDGIISKALDGTIQSWNAGAERIFGYSAKQAIGRDGAMLMPPDRLAEEDRVIADLEAGQRIDHYESRRLTRDGREIPVSITVSPLKDDDGQVVGVSKIFRDITERKGAEVKLRQLAADLSELNRRKNEFLALLAHELRNPLAPLSNMLEVLKRSHGDAGMFRRACSTMDRQLGQMVRLVDDLLDLSRISHNRLELRPSYVQLASVIQQAVEASQPLVDAAGHTLHVSLPDEPVYLHADPARLAQVFGNLLNNSIKYTKPGGQIWIDAVRDGVQAVVTVADNGIGITPEELDAVFDMFTQLDRSGEHAQGGLGIGLTLVRRLVQMHGGTIEARSQGHGRGSEFIVRLPVAVEAPAVAAVEQHSERDVAKRRILVVDDNQDSAESLTMLLQLIGHDTAIAHDGQQAIDAAERYRPDVVLLDIGLPFLDGYEVCRRVRAQPWGKDMVLIALTGWGQDEDRRRSLEAGFNGHLVKPVDHHVLTELLDTLPAPKVKSA